MHLEECEMIYFEKGATDVELTDQDLQRGLVDAFTKIGATVLYNLDW